MRKGEPMTPDEQRILEFLRSTTEFLSAREIGIAAAPPDGCANPTWAQPYLIRLTKARILDMNPAGQFRLKPSERGHFVRSFPEILPPRKAA